MTITIDLPDEVYQRLERQAQARGTTTAETVARLIEEIEATHLSDVIRQMQAEGLFAKPPATVPPAPANFQPIQVQGKPLSESLSRSAIDGRTLTPCGSASDTEIFRTRRD